MVTTKIHKCYTPTKFNLWECRSYGAHPLLSVLTQGFISGFALIPPWALQECRA